MGRPDVKGVLRGLLPSPWRFAVARHNLTVAPVPFGEGVPMRAVLQRVSRAKVTVSGETTGEIGAGWLVLLGIAPGDSRTEIDWLADKVANLRAFADDAGKMNLSVQDVGGAVLAVSQFTLYGDCRKGRRPGFTGAALPAVAEPLYEAFVNALRALGVRVATGRFGADMQVELVNDGPATFVLELEAAATDNQNR